MYIIYKTKFYSLKLNKMVISKDGRRIGEVGLLDWRCKIGVFALREEYGHDISV